MLMLTMTNDNDIALKLKVTIRIIFVFSRIIVLIIPDRPNSTALFFTQPNPLGTQTGPKHDLCVWWDVKPCSINYTVDNNVDTVEPQCHTTDQYGSANVFQLVWTWN